MEKFVLYREGKEYEIIVEVVNGENVYYVTEENGEEAVLDEYAYKRFFESLI